MAVAARDVASERPKVLHEIEGRALLAAFAEMAERMGDQSALKWKEGDVWRNLTWRDFRQTVLEVASGLPALGFKPGDFSALGASMHLQDAEVCACEKQLS